MGMIEDWDVPLFDVPPKYQPRARVVNYPQWRRYKGKRISCDDCIVDLAKGKTRFMAQPASFARIDESGRRFYCHRHAQEHKVDDKRGSK